MLQYHEKDGIVPLSLLAWWNDLYGPDVQVVRDGVLHQASLGKVVGDRAWHKVVRRAGETKSDGTKDSGVYGCECPLVCKEAQSTFYGGMEGSFLFVELAATSSVKGPPLRSDLTAPVPKWLLVLLAKLPLRVRLLLE